MPTKQLIGIQILRFIAAMLVVIMHSTEAISIRITGTGPDHYWSNGAIGVDIFFVISGFVMAMSTAKLSTDYKTHFYSAWTFMKRRLVRVVPLYWFYTLLKTALVLILPSLALRTSIDPNHLLASMFFIPSISPWGLIQPTLPVGWTLNFEMLFYVVFSIAIAFGTARIKFCFFIFLFIFSVAQVFSEFIVLKFYGQSLLFEFIIGMGIAHLYIRHSDVIKKIGLLTGIIGAMLILGLNFKDSLYGFSTWGVIAGTIVFFAVCLEPWIARSRFASKMTFLGDCSYSIYLSHTFVVPLGVLVLKNLGFQESMIIVPLICFAVIVVGILSYQLIELPLIRILKKAFFKRPIYSI